MTQIDIPLMTELFDKESKEFAILSEALACLAAGKSLA